MSESEITGREEEKEPGEAVRVLPPQPVTLL
jgi:hypothetical protein